MASKKAKSSNYVTKEEAQDLLGITAGDLKRRIQVGDLRTSEQYDPKLGRTVVLVSQEDIDFCLMHAKKTAEAAPSPSLADRYTPDDASKMFAALKANKSVEDCVIELKIHPRAAMAIKRAWDDVRGQVTFTREQLDKIEKLGLDGEFPIEAPEQLMSVLESAAAEKACVTCKAKPGVMCRGCAKKEVRVEKDANGNGVAVNGAPTVRS